LPHGWRRCSAATSLHPAACASPWSPALVPHPVLIPRPGPPPWYPNDWGGRHPDAAYQTRSALSAKFPDKHE
jgi:hypothetical protein